MKSSVMIKWIIRTGTSERLSHNLLLSQDMSPPIPARLIWVHPRAHQVSALSILEALGHSPFQCHQFQLEFTPEEFTTVHPWAFLSLSFSSSPSTAGPWPWQCCAWKSSIFRNFSLGVQISIIHSNYCLQQTQSLENWAADVSSLWSSEERSAAILQAVVFSVLHTRITNSF